MADMRAEARRLRADPGLSRPQLMKIVGVGVGVGLLLGAINYWWCRRPDGETSERTTTVA